MARCQIPSTAPGIVEPGRGRVLVNAGCAFASHGVLVTDSRSQMVGQLRQHLEKGDKVSQEVFWELQEEMKQLGDAVASQ